MADFNPNAPATKGDLQTVRDELVEVFRDIQTETLKAFYSFAESNQKRLTESERDNAGLKERVGILEKRVMDLERKIISPDQPAH